MVSHPDSIWPDGVTLRATRIYADEGQHILTTATGYGYEKAGYIRASLVDEALKALQAKIESVESKLAEADRAIEAFAIENENLQKRLDYIRDSDGLSATLECPKCRSMHVFLSEGNFGMYKSQLAKCTNCGYQSGAHRFRRI